MITAEEIKQLRNYLELSQEGFAHRLGVSFQTIHRWESGKSKPYPLAIKALEQLKLEIEQKGVKTE
jgi:DNA-binding transcriptional regulator YiaG